MNFGADLIVTRNTADYKRLPITTMWPANFVTMYISDEDGE